jgi:hypothetical protein
MPRAVFCIHALSLIMYRNGSAPKIQDLYGRAQFTEDEISIMQVCGALFRIRRIHMFLGLPAPDPYPSINKQKMKKNLDFYCFMTFLAFFLRMM